MKVFLLLIIQCLTMLCCADIAVSIRDDENAWEFDENEEFEDGKTHLRTCQIGDGSSTSFGVSVEGTDEFPFVWRVSSEYSYDYLSVYVDGVIYGTISGEETENLTLYLPDSSTHEIVWVYEKDGSAADGSDCGWIWFEGINQLEGLVIDSDPFPSEPLRGCVFGLDAAWGVDCEEWYRNGYAIKSREMPGGGETSFQIELPRGCTRFTCWCKVSCCDNGTESVLYISGPSDDVIIDGNESGASEWREISFECNPSSQETVRWTYVVGEHSGCDARLAAWLRLEELDGYAVGLRSESFELICDDSGLAEVKSCADADQGVSIQSEGEYAWTIDYENGYESRSSLRSAANLGAGTLSKISLTVVGEGILSFMCKASGGVLEYRVDDDAMMDVYDSTNDWTPVSCMLSDDRRHVVEIVYRSSSNETDYGLAWLDQIRWSAPKGWDDPDVVKRPISVTVSTPIDVRPSPRAIRVQDVSELTSVKERVYFDPKWIGGERIVVRVNGEQIVDSTEPGHFDWTPQAFGRYDFVLQVISDAGNTAEVVRSASFVVGKEKGATVFIY